jgi:hypothetical protein
MAKKTKVNKALDSKHFGDEPDLSGNVSRIDIMKALNWYSYNCEASQAKEWVIEYLKKNHKTEKELIKNVNRIDDSNLRTCGWICRILNREGKLPEQIVERNLEKIRRNAERLRCSDRTEVGTSDRTGQGEGGTVQSDSTGSNKDNPKEDKQVISIQERVANRASELIADIEVQLDNYYNDGTMFKASDWLSQHDVKPAIAQRIADYYKPLYSEAYDAFLGKDPQLREGYSHYKKTKLKAYVEFLKSIVSAAETRATVMKTVRKPRKKKEKPVSVIVGKLKYKEKDDEYAIVSVDPKQIIGSNQLWVFNTKYRTLAVYNAMGPAGLGVKGSTVIGFDEKTSIVKKLRKPKEQLKTLNEGGKIILRKFMDGIKCKPKAATGRINTETVLVRIIK